MDALKTYLPHEIIDVWRVAANGTSYVTDREPTADEATPGEYTITKEQMTRGEYDALPEFTGF